MVETTAIASDSDLRNALEAERQRYKLQLLHSELLQVELDKKERLITQLRADLLKGIRAARVQQTPRPVEAVQSEESDRVLDTLSKALLQNPAPSGDDIRRFLVLVCGKVMASGQTGRKHLHSEGPLRQALEKALSQCGESEFLKDTRRILDHAGVIMKAG